MRPGLTTLRGIPAFQHLPDHLLRKIDEITTVTMAEQGQELCREGALPSFLYYVLEGRVALSTTAPDGARAVVEVIHPPGDFVLASLVMRVPYLQAAHAVTRVRLLAIEEAPLRGLVERTPELALALLRSLSRDFRNLVLQVRDLKVRTTAQRLGCYLLALMPDPTATEAVIRLPFEKGLLAARLGCRQENLSRAFAALRELGVETRGARVTLRDIPRLTAYAMPDYLNHPELAETGKDEIAKSAAI
jgi:CRP/FNR family transcriptional regulator, transcriptional activator FtrB